MPFLNFDNIKVSAMAAATPETIQTLDNIDPALSDQVKSFQKFTGVKQRYISLCGQTALDLGCCAAKEAFRHANIPPEEIDGIIFLSQTPDFNAGTGNAFLAHYLLNLKADCLAFDIPLACSSFPYGISVAGSLLQQPAINKILLISGDTQWAFYPDGKPYASPGGPFMFGEACTAIIVEKSASAKPINISLFTDGSGYKYLFNPVGGCRNAWSKGRAFKLPNGDVHNVVGKFGYMDGIEITSFSTTRVVNDIKGFLDKTDHKINDFDGIILHQANRQIVSSIAKRLKAETARVPYSLDRYGNTSGASASLTIIDAYAGSEKKDLFLFVCAFGTGLSWGMFDLHINPAVITPVVTCASKFEEGEAKAVK